MQMLKIEINDKTNEENLEKQLRETGVPETVIEKAMRSYKYQAQLEAELSTEAFIFVTTVAQLLTLIMAVDTQDEPSLTSFATHTGKEITTTLAAVLFREELPPGTITGYMDKAIELAKLSAGTVRIARQNAPTTDTPQ